VQQARRTADTVVVYLHWGTETGLPQPPAGAAGQQLVKAGADIVIGTNAHVLLGGGYLGSAYVDYGLGNFAFYDDTGARDLERLAHHHRGGPPHHQRHLPSRHHPRRPAPTPQRFSRRLPLQSWNAARSCTDLAATPSSSLADARGELSPFVAPTTTTTTTSTTTPATGSTATTTTSTRPVPATTQPTDNAG
jgi:hypothetical protein